MVGIGSRVAGYNLRRPAWACRECGTKYDKKLTKCKCGGAVHYFPSQSECKRFQELRALESVGIIEGLELQPRYPLTVGSKKISEYRADFRYQQKGQTIVEDVKGTTKKKALDPLFRIKRDWVEALYGIKINLVTR